MDVTQLPFNRLIGLEHASGDRLLVALPAGPHYGNHVGTVHASALLALAEAGSGKFLLRTLGPAIGFLPVVRRLEAKFRRPAVDWVAARAAVQDGEAGRWATECRTVGGFQPRCQSKWSMETGRSFCRPRSIGSSRG